MESNPGVCKAFVLNDKNLIVQDHFLGFGTSNLAEYSALVYAIKESSKSKDYVNVITSSQTAFNWLIKGKPTNNVQGDENAQLICDILDELTDFNSKLKIGKVKSNGRESDVYFNLTDNIRVVLRPQRRWLSIYRNRILTID